ncbi:MAG: TerB family tellurite resistance protein [Candidatus Marinimicrobia bacterium]|nr:TerB family tellurite resistance protein [Candidatus Neomarinimicrobiota bacterium]
MSFGKRLIWGGIGWALGGPIGGIIGYALASLSQQTSNDGATNFGGGFRSHRQPSVTQSGDFAVSLLVLFATVMKADRQMLKSELEYIKQFLNKQFGSRNARDLFLLFRDIIEQDYPLRDVCRQIQRSMDHPSRLELIHVLFGLSKADGQIHPEEISVIKRIAKYLNISDNDYYSIRAMFVEDTDSTYKILGVDPRADDLELKRAYRHMANKYHPDKVAHLGVDLQNLAEDKFKAVNGAYQKIKAERQIP